MPATQTPPKEVFAVVYTESTYVPGDERSRTNPGHGYPAETVYHKVFKEFKDEAEWRDWIDRETRRKTEFTAYRCTPVTVSTEVKINIG